MVRSLADRTFQLQAGPREDRAEVLALGEPGREPGGLRRVGRREELLRVVVALLVPPTFILTFSNDLLLFGKP